jgi:phosphoenolpyruvate-protein kinase (PTS system EI component)
MHPAQLLAIKERVLKTSIVDILPMAARVLRSTDSRRTQELLHKLNS